MNSKDPTKIDTSANLQLPRTTKNQGKYTGRFKGYTLKIKIYCISKKGKNSEYRKV